MALTTDLKTKCKKRRWERESLLCPLFKVFQILLGSARPLDAHNFSLSFPGKKKKNNSLSIFLFVLSFIHNQKYLLTSAGVLAYCKILKFVRVFWQTNKQKNTWFRDKFWTLKKWLSTTLWFKQYLSQTRIRFNSENGCNDPLVLTYFTAMDSLAYIFSLKEKSIYMHSNIRYLDVQYNCTIC